MVLDPTTRDQVNIQLAEVRRAWGRRPALERVAIRATFYVTHHRCDLDGKYTTIQDILKDAGVIASDNTKHVVRFTARAIKGAVDQCHVRIRELPEERKARHRVFGGGR